LGGYGSTRWKWHDKKWCVEDCLPLSADQLASTGAFGHTQGTIEWWKGQERIATAGFLLKPSDVPEYRYMYLSYSVTLQDKVEDVSQPLPINIRPQRLGQRYYFCCHFSRVRIVYLCPETAVFRCRQCHGLTYRSAQEHDKGMDILRRNPDLLLAAANAGSGNACFYVLRRFGVFPAYTRASIRVTNLD